MARRLSSPVFVGRTNELHDALRSGRRCRVRRQPLSSSSAARPGSARAGSSPRSPARLRDRGWLVLEGGSVALGDDGLPFGPIVEALRALVRDVDPDRIAAAAGPSLPSSPVSSRSCPWSAGDGAAPAGQVEWLQTRIFEGILRLLGRLGEPSPVLLVVEDLHWADRSTRDLLAFLARNARDERLLIVGHLPDRRAPSPPPADGLAGRGRTAAARRTHRSGALRADELIELLAAHHRRAAGRDPGRLRRPPVGWQRLLRRGAGRRRRRARVSAATACPRPCAASCWSACPRPRNGRPPGRDRGRRGPRGRP